jgi:predicted hydrolase (HD superfamily)
VGEIMRAFAKELGQDEHYRWLAGALHDIDRDHIAKDADKHLKDEFDRIMATIDAPELLKNDIKSHGDRLT